LPELPMEKIKRFQEEHGLPEYDATVLTSEKELADYYEKVGEAAQSYKAASNWIMTELLRELNQGGLEISQTPIRPDYLGRLIKLIDEGKISGKIAKKVFSEMWESQKDPETIIK